MVSPPRRSRASSGQSAPGGAPPVSTTATTAAPLASSGDVAPAGTRAATLLPPTGMPTSSAATLQLPPELLSQIVAQVTSEVTRQLRPFMAAPQPSQEQAQAGNHLSQPLVEVPLEQDQARDHAPAAVTEASEQVQVAVQHLHSSLAGETSSLPGTAKPTELFTSVYLPVDARVPAKIKTKIWQEEYIDFGSLFVNPTLDGGFQFTIQNSGEGSSPSLALEPLTKPKLEPLTKPKRITTIDAWMQAFHVFVGIYVG